MTTKDTMKRVKLNTKRDTRLDDLEELAEATFSMVKPTLDDAKKLTDLYNESPSIVNGSRMHSARLKAKRAVEDAVTALTNIWECEYRDAIGFGDFAELLKQSIEKVLGETTPRIVINGGC